MTGNKLRVRKYYHAHRDQVLARKILFFIERNGRVTRYRTVVDLNLDLPSVVEAFTKWRAGQAADDARVQKQSRKIVNLCVADMFFRAAKSDLSPVQ